MRLGIVQAPQPIRGPQAVLAYLSRSTQRVAISHSRLTALDKTNVIRSGRIRAVRQNQRIIAFDACDRPLACNVCRLVAAPGRRAGTTLAFIDALGPPLDHLVDQPELLRSLGGKERVALHSLFDLLDRLAGVFHVNLV